MRICFYSNVSDVDIFNKVEFYKQDIDALLTIDPQMKITNKCSEIRWKSDLIVIWWWSYALVPIVVSKFFGCKTMVVGTFNYRTPGYNLDYFHRPFWQRIILKLAVKFADFNVFVSKNEYNQIINDFKYSNIHYSPHCINTSLYHRLNERSDDFLFALSALSRDNVQRKCIYELIDAMAILKNEGFGIPLKLAGLYSDAYKDIKQYIIDCNLTDMVHLVGEISVDEKIFYFQNCICYLQPTKYEGFGVAIAEAMSCGAPVISSNEGEVPNVLGDAGILIVDNSPQEIASSILKMTNDKDLRNYYSEKARCRILRNFPIEKRYSDIRKFAKMILI